MVKTNRGLLKYILLSIVTCGLYSLYFTYELAKDVNTMCEGDGKHTAGLIKLLLLSTVTCGIYGLIWYYQLGNRLAENAPKYNLTFSENGTTILLWQLLGSALFGIGPLIALYIIIKNTNSLANAYESQIRGGAIA